MMRRMGRGTDRLDADDDDNDDDDDDDGDDDEATTDDVLDGDGIVTPEGDPINIAWCGNPW